MALSAAALADTFDDPLARGRLLARDRGGGLLLLSRGAQNADKHARGATAAVVELSDNGVLRIEVRDDGAGFDGSTATAGAGFANMRSMASS